MAPTYTPRRVTSEDERKAYSTDYIHLDVGEKFIGHALFKGDPTEPEKGYYEYWEHYDPSLGKNGRSVPCAGDDCPYCAADEKPRVRAKAAFLVLQEDDKILKEPIVKTMTLGPSIINQLTELRKENEVIFGRAMRISRPSEKEYAVATKTEKITQAAAKEHLKAVSDYGASLTRTLQAAMERNLMSSAMRETDADAPAAAQRNGDGEEAPATAKGKPAAKASPGDWPDQIEDTVVTVDSVEAEGNYFTASSEEYGGQKNVWTTSTLAESFDLTTLAEGQVVTIAATLDGDGDYILDANPEVAAEPEAGEGGTELPENIEGDIFTVTGVEAGNSTMEVENDELGLSFTLYFLDKGPGSDVNFDDFSAGDKIKVFAEKDTDGDMVANATIEKVEGAKGAKGAGAKGAKGAAAGAKGK